MSPIFLGVGAALAWGLHDFAARFAGQRIGAAMALLCVTVTGFAGLTAWLLATGTDFPAVRIESFWLIVLIGSGFTLATLWLYEAVTRGPFSLVSPIVGSYPVTAMLFFVTTGTRPSLAQWTAIAAVIVGVIIVAAAVRDEKEATGEVARPAALTPHMYRTIVVYAALSHLAFAVSITASQFAAPVYGELEATWLARIVGFVIILAVVVAKRAFTAVPLVWTPVVIGMGLLDVTALASVSASGHTPNAELATVVSSTFGVVAILLAWMFLRERISPVQWIGIATVFGGTAWLAT